ncbi:conserved hypothetical protein [gamma proteobacterium NOR5-3]|nr:conserved hypothetical protein [gamma proteobacterium NOR5-3]
MLLRSVSQHMKDQNWLAVWLDFVIVVVGVFIGIQVANWNELQNEQIEAQRTLNTALVDLVALREEISQTVVTHLDVAIAIDAFMNSMESDHEIPPEIARRVIQSAALVGVFPSTPAALDDLLVAVRLDLLGEDAMRDALRTLAEELEATESFLAENLKQYSAGIDGIYPYVSVNRTPGVKGRQFEVGAVDVDAMRSDHKTRIALTKLYIYHSNQHSAMQGVIDAIDLVFAEAHDVSER